MHSPKNAFFYVIDRTNGKLISADPITKVSWSTGVDPKTGKMLVNPEARYTKEQQLVVSPGPSGGHVWPSWSYSPQTGLMYIPGTAGGTGTYRAADDFEPQSVDIGPTGRGVMNMGTQFGGGQTKGGAGQGKGKGKGIELPDAVAAGGAGKQAPLPQVEPAKPKQLATIGPDGPTGNVLYAWDPIARKEKWRAAGGGAGPFAGGALATAGNVVFSSVNDHLIAYNAQTGDKLAEFPLPIAQMSPPMSISIGGKQYVFVAGGPAQGGGRGAGKGKGDASAPPAAPAVQKMFALALP
jgi:outer membrane protein assembly factor BamB